jgi:hypothetical protein
MVNMLMPMVKIYVNYLCMQNVYVLYVHRWRVPPVGDSVNPLIG